MASNNGTDDLNRADFGPNFIFGASTSNYQIEGGTDEGGRGPATWDTFIQKYPYYMFDKSNANTAADSYYLYKEDVKALKNLGVDSYRFSISWSRILPGGTIKAGINREGIKYYNDLIDELLAHGIKPFVTLFHWDVPQALEDSYLSWLSYDIVKDFSAFVELCFWEFGDRVKHWITLNEPENFIIGGYVTGALAPGRGIFSPDHISKLSVPGHRCSKLEIPIMPASGNAGTEPYIVAHHMLIAHAEVVQIYREKYKAQRGKIGMTLVSEWYEPLNNTDADNEAVERAFDFTFGWFMLPLVEGRYPDRMVERVGQRLPKFSEEQSKKLIGSYDFLGLNYYTGQYATVDPISLPTPTYLSDRAVKLQSEGADGTLIGPKLGTSTTCFYPEGLFNLLLRINSEYADPLIYITENGMDQANDPDTVGDINDDARIQFLQGHLEAIKKAKDENGINVQGYFIWSLLDDFEWNSGYLKRMGIINVNFNDDCTRLPKNSALWYMNFLDEGSNVQEIPKTKGSKRALDVSKKEAPKRKSQRH